MLIQCEVVGPADCNQLSRNRGSLVWMTETHTRTTELHLESIYSGCIASKDPVSAT